MVDLTLPFPPSVNTYWRHPTTGRLAGRHLISDQGRAYRAAVASRVEQLRYDGVLSRHPLSGRLSLFVSVSAPDNRRRDLDNLPKALFDALTHAGVWNDDSQIDELRILRLASGGNQVRVVIRDMAGLRAAA